jgi:hypothetical protein
MTCRHTDRTDGTGRAGSSRRTQRTIGMDQSNASDRPDHHGHRNLGSQHLGMGVTLGPPDPGPRPECDLVKIINVSTGGNAASLATRKFVEDRTGQSLAS